MKVFLTILFLIFSIQSWTKADDIKDFQIEGMSIGDSLLDYFSAKDIKKINVKVGKDYIVRDLKKYFYEEKNGFNSRNYLFVLNVNYNRSYWISDNKKYRATIDQNLIINPINNLSFNLNLNETMLEFKFLPKFESSFREFYHKKNFNFRAKKFSKYIQSFNLLEDSGLIN